MKMVRTLAQLIAEVRDAVHDPYGYRWSDEAIKRYLNDAQVDLKKDSRELFTWQFNIGAGTVQIDRPADLLIPKYAYFETGVERIPLRFTHEYPPSHVTGSPEKICVIGNVYYFYPVPSPGGRLILLGVRRPDPMENADDTPSVEDADTALVAYAVWQCFLASGDPMASVMQSYYAQLRTQWLVLDAMKNPTTTVIEREWWDG